MTGTCTCMYVHVIVKTKKLQLHVRTCMYMYRYMPSCIFIHHTQEHTSIHVHTHILYTYCMNKMYTAKNESMRNRDGVLCDDDDDDDDDVCVCVHVCVRVHVYMYFLYTIVRTVYIQSCILFCLSMAGSVVMNGLWGRGLYHALLQSCRINHGPQLATSLLQHMTSRVRHDNAIPPLCQVLGVFSLCRELFQMSAHFVICSSFPPPKQTLMIIWL